LSIFAEATESFERDEVEDRRDEKIDSQQMMVIMFWKFDGFHVIERLSGVHHLNLSLFAMLFFLD
jgi:hypothetical protein